jgi:hypothetical protein
MLAIHTHNATAHLMHTVIKRGIGSLLAGSPMVDHTLYRYPSPERSASALTIAVSRIADDAKGKRCLKPFRVH